MNSLIKTVVHSCVISAAIAGGGVMSSVAFGEEMKMPAGKMEHHHHHMIEGTTRRVVDYTIPDVKLVRDDGKRVSLPKELNSGKPVVLTFIYTSCTTVCPVITQNLAELQDALGAERDRVEIASISIDPEQDTPARLAEYAKKFGAGPEWHHYTGTVAASETAQRAFDVYRGDKMDHNPVTLMRAAPGKPWVRIDGFATPKELLAEVQGMFAANESHGNHISMANP